MPRYPLLALVILTASAKSAAPQRSALERDKETVETAKRADRDLDAIRRGVLAAAKAAVVPRPDLGPCPVSWKPHFAPKTSVEGNAATNTTYWNVGRWDASDEKAFGIFAPHMDDEMVSIERLGIAFAEEVAEKPGPRHFRIVSDSDPLPLGARQRSELEKYVDPNYEPTDQQLVIDAEVDAQITGDKTFVPGQLKARFYIYDHSKRAIVCASHVLVESSAELIVRYNVEYDRNSYETKSDDKAKSTADHLRGDLRQQALLAASDSLFVAGGVDDAGARDAGRDAK